ncbi:RagB/SusD family nutrient uptake outer membrane protein [Flavobacterium sp. GA093]|uniref:RagB/SusD family nutrient uptake outer membrane protein n=1 Tax=Flavobacterium hydrocarbonoxydans TaxID=2683249 RepID=A0A6I4NI27_9FLAO|nr:RagB/SusD family nutrient uptake outer membrane protein [Flavobacterium hydrocarbonoxydans]MWB93958.1 RagB/SusD family nutrient uptake outer membrane protein [Flavobacterium hydrocarbonoxydans]
MRKLKITLSLLLLISISSCDEFLSETPDNRTQIDTPEKIAELLVNAYPKGSYMEFAETMSDNVFDSGDPSFFEPNNTQNYNWEMNEAVDTDSQANYWDACYNAIAHANKALQAIEELGTPTNLLPLKGEALMARAYAHFMLVTFWSERYNPATAKTDLGIPYVLKPEEVLLEKYKRNSMAEVFAYLESDIEEGLLYVRNDYSQPKFHFNENAAKAFATRFYIVKGDWERVIQLSEELAANPDGKLRDYTSYLALDFNTRVRVYGDATQETNLLITSAQSWYERSFYQNRFQLTGARQDEVVGFSTNLFNKDWNFQILSYNGQITVFVPKFDEYFKYTNPNAGIGNGYVSQVLLSNNEFYLNRIEALVMENRFAEANTAMQYILSTLTDSFDPATDVVTEELIIDKYPVIENEYTPFYELTDKQKSYIKAIAQIRRVDFIHEGIRWFDIKRFGLEVKHDIYNQPTIVLAKNDKRRALQIPLHASSNGIEKNPR